MIAQRDLLFDWLKGFRLISYMFAKSKSLTITTLASAFQPLFCLLICLTFSATSNTAFGDRPANIVIILADDLGCCDMALYDGWVKTPRIEQMAKQGMRVHGLPHQFLSLQPDPRRVTHRPVPAARWHR